MTQATEGSTAQPNAHLSSSPAPMPTPHEPRPDIAGSIGIKPVVVAPAKAPTHLSREQILDATAACLAELGYDGTTIRRIAKQLDCAVGSIYRYFDDKRALLAAVVQRRFEPVVERIEQNAPIDAVATMYSMIAAEQPELYRLMFWLASVGQSQHTNTVPAIVKQVIQGWAKQLDDQRAAEGYWAQLHGSIMLGNRGESLPIPQAHSKERPEAPAGRDDLTLL